MKKMLIAASAVGAAIAGLILYTRNRMERPAPGIGNGSGHTFPALDKRSVSTERNAMHSMG